MKIAGIKMELQQTDFSNDITQHKELQNFHTKLPLFTIITVVRNCGNTIEKTILSVLNQGYKNFEYIIIDGSSTDNTMEVVKKYNDKIDFWISEPDRGIYDAMNKGIGYAHGEFVNFLNAGDVFANNNVLEKIADQSVIRQKDIIYGDFIAIDEKNVIEKIVKAKSISQIWNGMIFSHQACFIKTNILKEVPFDISYKTSADYNQICTLHNKNCTFHYLSFVIAKTTIGGISYSNLNTTFENIKISHSHNPNLFNTLYFIPILIGGSLKIAFGEKNTSFLRKIKWIIKK